MIQTRKDDNIFFIMDVIIPRHDMMMLLPVFRI